MANTDIQFAIDLEKGSVCWFFKPERPDLTEQQAMVISATQLVGAVREAAGSLGSIADALNNIAEAIREKGE